MCGDATASTVFAPECGREADAPCSSTVAVRGAAASPRNRRPYTSLRGRNAFRRVLRTGRRRRSGGVTVVVAPSPGPTPQVGVVVGRALGGSVARNRAKRRIREAMARVTLEREADYVVIASGEVNEVDFHRLVTWLSAGVGGEA